MTRKLFHTILTSWLLFSSLYLPAQAETATSQRDVTLKAPTKKSTEALFAEGTACLEQSDITQSNISCARTAQALIGSMSPYAKILDGAIAQHNRQPEQALLVLLPLQADDTLSMPAKILLHRTLALAFKNLGDTQQSIQHFITTESLLKLVQTADANTAISATHEQIWQQLQPLAQAELIALRANNTDSAFQGWIDLRLASLHVASKAHIADWRSIYADHSAQTFAQQLSEQSTSSLQTTVADSALKPESVIALILPTLDDKDKEKLMAFKLGLETAANLASISSPIEVYHQDQTQPEETPAADYFITPDFKSAPTVVISENIADKPTLRIGLPVHEEAQSIWSFTRQHNMQYATIVTTQQEDSQTMLSSLQQAWTVSMALSGFDAPNIISLDADILAQPIKLLDLKSQIASKLHDIVILAMPAEDIVKIRPYLDISVPTITFSAIHDIAAADDALKRLNALRFVDMPFLLETRPASDSYANAAATLQQKSLLRWFALGADSLQLVNAVSRKPTQAQLIKGLAGSYHLSESGTLTRSLSTARFTQNGIAAD